MSRSIPTINGLRNASEMIDEVLAERNRPSLVTIEAGLFCVHDPDLYDSTYEIPVDSCTSRDDVLLWFRQLSEKRWVTIQVIEDFSKTLISHFNVAG